MTKLLDARGLRKVLAIATVGLAIGVGPMTIGSMTGTTEAEAAKRGGFGSRGERTFQAPAATNTAPRTAAPIERTATPQPSAAQPGMAQQASAAQAARPGLFGGLGGSILGGLVLGGLFGALLGGGFGGIAGFFGMLLQVGLIALVVMLALRFFRGRRQAQPAAQTAYGAAPEPNNPNPANTMYREASGNREASGPMGGGLFDRLKGGLGGGLGGYRAARSGQTDEIGIQGEDFENFERLLGDIQTAYGRRDEATLRDLMTEEAFGYMKDELAEIAERGLINEISEVKLLQGDLAEAWREGAVEYATVAMRFGMIDVMRDKATGRIVDGHASEPTELTQIWTFVRDRGQPANAWRLTAIQDVDADEAGHHDEEN